MKKYITLTKTWVEENGHDSILDAINKGEKRISGSSDINYEIYVAKVMMVIKRVSPIMLLDMNEVE